MRRKGKLGSLPFVVFFIERFEPADIRFCGAKRELSEVSLWQFAKLNQFGGFFLLLKAFQGLLLLYIWRLAALAEADLADAHEHARTLDTASEALDDADAVFVIASFYCYVNHCGGIVAWACKAGKIGLVS